MLTSSNLLNSNILAIIVPAFKAKYLRAALQSIASQTDQRFNLYVCDDCSPEDLESIYRSTFSDPSRGHYIRFPENLGCSSLVAQWNRCVEKTGGEPWLWLFSDDDLMDKDCVASFYRQRGLVDSDLYRFDTLTIDGFDNVITINPPHPMAESAMAFAYHRLNFKRDSFVVEYIFSREAFVRLGGFIPFPWAWCSDDASWIAFGGDRPIIGIPGSKVRWRSSAINNGGSPKRNTMEKIEAMILYSAWLESHAENEPAKSDRHIMDVLPKLLKHWFFRDLMHYYPLSLSQIWQVGEKISRRWPEKSALCWAIRIVQGHVGWVLRGAGNRLSG